ncbi:hypothetical protein J2751_000186 [Halorubrum alkaliphilum]|uniref:Uncharacterized protein n=1 Tax=Halorubrum alkaliphilum TaxID=261290 RepID=A0A8T4GAT6_9EURY|nr:hypothetical protein [Halorubrum alkaliphilum]MBP1921203.1 hypothetical protein [Halorubrum alkaliphilum]
MTDLTRALVGDQGFERAAVWTAVGFGVTLAAFRGATVIGGPDARWVAATCTIVTALGVIGFARVGGGVLPSVLLAYGPLAAVLFETVGPTVSLAAGGGVVFAPNAETVVGVASSVAEPLAVAVAAAVAVGGAGYVAGRSLGALAGPTDNDVDDARSGDRDAQTSAGDDD